MRRRSFVALSLALLLLQVPAGRAERPGLAVHVGSYVWHRPDRAFGGFSGLELSADGRDFVSQSDRGAIVAGRLRRDPAGAVVGVEAGPITPLRAPDGAILRPTRRDAEGLAITPSGKVFISFEGIQRVLEYDHLGAAARALPRDPAFLRMAPNGSIEALAVDRSGALYTLPEMGPIGRPIPVFRYAGGRWTQPFSIGRPDAFRPVGADFGPDGNLYLLERRFLGLFGFASRVRRLDIGANGRPTGDEVLFQSPPGKFGNLEGLAVWTDARGRIRLTMISDDNFFFLQRTEFVDYRVVPRAAGMPRPPS